MNIDGDLQCDLCKRLESKYRGGDFYGLKRATSLNGNARWNLAAAPDANYHLCEQCFNEVWAMWGDVLLSRV